MRGRAALLLAAGIACLAVLGASAAPSAQTTTFTFAKVDASDNPNAPELKIDTTARTATWDHCCDGGKWHVVFYWTVPDSFTAGATTHVTAGIRDVTVAPSQPLFIQMTVLAPDFAQPVSINYPGQTSGEKTFDIPISSSYTGSKAPAAITIGVVSAHVVYTYNPSTTTTQPTKSVTEPAPGSSMTITSPHDLPGCTTGYRLAPEARACGGVTTTVTSSSGGFGGTTIVGTEGKTAIQKRSEAIAACWLIGPDALQIDNSAVYEWVHSSTVQDYFRLAEKYPLAYLELCRQLVDKIAEDEYPREDNAFAGTAAMNASCRAQPLVLDMRRRKGKPPAVTLRRGTTPSTPVRYSCSGTGGTERISITGAHVATALGPKLRLGIVRWKHAKKRSARLKFAYSF